MRTYIKTQRNVVEFFKEYLLLHKSLKQRSANAETEVARIIQDYRKISELIGRSLSDCDLLEIGVGQTPLRLAFFSSHAKSAVGLDLDVIATRFNLFEFIRMIKHNGFTRTARTFGRQILGLNDAIHVEFCRQLGFCTFPKLSILQGDVCARAPFKDASFDVIVSTNVFEHLATPSRALDEIARLLRPGGIVLTMTCHWGQANAIHDLEAMYGIKPARWAHLRPSLQHEVKQHAFVNELRISDWQALFSRYFDTTSVSSIPATDTAALEKEISVARANGELEGFSDTELLCETCVIRSVKR